MKKIGIIIVFTLLITGSLNAIFIKTSKVKADDINLDFNIDNTPNLLNEQCSQQRKPIHENQNSHKIIPNEKQKKSTKNIAQMDYSCMCDWAGPNCGDHGPEKTNFDQCDIVYFYAEVSNVNEGDIFKTKWKYNDQIIYQEEFEPTGWSGSGCLWVPRYPSRIGTWHVDLYCNNNYIGDGPGFSIKDVPIELEYSCMCDWAGPNYGEHGPEKTNFNQDDHICYYAEYNYANYNDLFSLKCYCNGNLVYENEWDEPINWSGQGCSWMYWTESYCGTCYVEFYCNGNYLGDGPQFNVNNIDPPNYPPDPAEKPDGETLGTTDKVYTYSTITQDPDEDDISYGWDWNGDGQVDEWSDPYPNNQVSTRSHMWENKGIYNIKVKTKDENNQESDWSETLRVKIISPPYIQTYDAEDIGSTSVTLKGQIIDDGGQSCTIHFKYKKTNSDDWYHYIDESGTLYNNQQIYSKTFNDLSPNTRYDFYAGANNTAGTNWGEKKQFKTMANQNPGKPEPPIGPEDGSPGEKYSFICYAPDAEGDDIYFQFLFTGYVGTGTFEQVTKRSIKHYGPYESNKEVTVDEVYIPDSFLVNQGLLISVRATNKDLPPVEDKYFSHLSEPTTMHLTSTPENLEIKGPSSIKPRQTYSYTFSAEEPDNENIYYYINWGDGTNTGWMGRYNSGKELTLEHQWNKKDNYDVKFKAKDKWDVESDWKKLPISVSKTNDITNDILSNFFENHPYLYRLIQLITRFFEIT